MTSFPPASRQRLWQTSSQLMPAESAKSTPARSNSSFLRYTSAPSCVLRGSWAVSISPCTRRPSTPIATMPFSSLQVSFMGVRLDPLPATHRSGQWPGPIRRPLAAARAELQHQDNRWPAGLQNIRPVEESAMPRATPTPLSSWSMQRRKSSESFSIRPGPKSSRRGDTILSRRRAHNGAPVCGCTTEHSMPFGPGFPRPSEFPLRSRLVPCRRICDLASSSAAGRRSWFLTARRPRPIRSRAAPCRRAPHGRSTLRMTIALTNVAARQLHAARLRGKMVRRSIAVTRAARWPGFRGQRACRSTLARFCACHAHQFAARDRRPARIPGGRESDPVI